MGFLNNNLASAKPVIPAAVGPRMELNSKRAERELKQRSRKLCFDWDTVNPYGTNPTEDGWTEVVSVDQDGARNRENWHQFYQLNEKERSQREKSEDNFDNVSTEVACGGIQNRRLGTKDTLLCDFFAEKEPEEVGCGGIQDRRLGTQDTFLFDFFAEKN